MNILILATADWDHPFWTNKQHVAKSLAEAGHKVIYIDSLGLRKLRAGKNDRDRIIRRIKGIIFSPRKVLVNLWVVSPLVLPGIENKFINLINSFFLNLTLIYCYQKLGFKCNILWTYSPATTLYLNPNKFKYSIYHCVDDISVQPDMPGNYIRILERDLSHKVNTIFTTTNTLMDKLGSFCSSKYVLPNVVDYDHFAFPKEESIQKANNLMRRIKQPIIGFVGAISNYKINFDLIKSCAERYPNFSFIFIGSIGEGEGNTDISKITNLRNIFFLGPQSYKDLPGLMSKFDIAILPSHKNQYTNSMFPMKFFEYLAIGLPIVAIEIPALVPYKQYASLCIDNESFLQSIYNEVSDAKNPVKRKERKEFAKLNTYKNRTKKMIKIIQERI